MKKSYYLLPLFIVLFCACSKKGTIYLSVQEPSPVLVPSTVLRIGIIDRSLPEHTHKTLDDVEKALSLEGVNLDKTGAETAVAALRSALTGDNKRYTEVVLIHDDHLRTTGAGIFPGPLSWPVVEKLCKANKVDALVSLEFFDTNSKVTVAANTTTVNTPLGNVPAIEHTATMVTSVSCGWRFYNLQNKQITDEYHNSESMSFISKGTNPLTAVQALMNRKEAVIKVADASGQAYSGRILPYWTRVSRTYYTKGNNDFATAKRKAQAGNWDGAAELWKAQTQNADPKLAGRACHNYAIINEINGDIDQAIVWAQKAYEDYNNKLSLNYINILRYRKKQAQRLS